MSDELRDLRDRTRARPDAVARIKRGTAGTPTPEAMKALLSALPSPPPGAAERIKANTAGLRPRPRRRWARTAAAALVAGVAGFLLLLLRPHADVPLALDVGAGRHADLGGLTVDADGRGRLTGTRAHPRLAWEQGEVRLDATGADVVIETREAEIRVREDAVSVTRDVGGTSVRAERGRARVRCRVDGAEYDASPDDGVACPPVSAEGMLGRARHERAEGRSAHVVLATVDEGLGRAAGSDAARAELAVLRMQVLAGSGRGKEALDAARAWLATNPTLRRDEVERLAAGLALTEEGCAGALPHLEALSPTWLDAALRLAACAPDRAPRVLEAAAALVRTPEDRKALDETRSRLGVK